MVNDYVVLSFFKEKKIDYIYSPEKNIVKIPCFKCNSESIMCTKTTNWSCKNCGEQGTLLTYISFTDNNKVDLKIYNPINEKKQINNVFNRLLDNKNLNKSSKRSIRYLQNKVDEMIRYYERV